MTLSAKQIEINRLACELAKRPRSEFENELNKIPLDKLRKILNILNEHYDILVNEFGEIK